MNKKSVFVSNFSCCGLKTFFLLNIFLNILFDTTDFFRFLNHKPKKFTSNIFFHCFISKYLNTVELRLSRLVKIGGHADNRELIIPISIFNLILLHVIIHQFNVFLSFVYLKDWLSTFWFWFISHYFYNLFYHFSVIIIF